jgi:hypothetical protein
VSFYWGKPLTYNFYHEKENYIMGKMTITRALAELKMLDKRINNAISSADFCILKKKGQKHIDGKEVADVQAIFKSNFDSIRDLIQYKQKLKGAVVQANATTLVKIAGNEYTIAQAIDLKNSLEYNKAFRKKLWTQFVSHRNEVERLNTSVAQAAERDAAQAFGTKQKSSTAEYAQYVEDYKERHEVELIEGFDTKNEIAALDAFLEEFYTEVDFILSEANATTYINLD